MPAIRPLHGMLALLLLATGCDAGAARTAETGANGSWEGGDVQQAPAAAPAPAHAPAAAARAAPRGDTKPFAFDAPEAGNAGGGTCGFPGLVLPEDTRVYAAGAYGGRALGYQIDASGHEATRLDVAVNHRGAPVVLLLGSYEPTVWNIGWSRGTRVLAVLVGGYHRQVVTGLPPDVPLLVSTYDNRGACGYFYVTAAKARELNPVARRTFGRSVDMVFPASGGRVVVGDPLAGDAGLVTDAGARGAEAFRIPDAEQGGPAGLAYAVSQGWLREATQADADAWLAARAAAPQADVPPIAGGAPAGRISLFNGYVVLKAFRLPPGLYGAHSATFFVPRGVPRPTGDLGHSRLYDFNTLTCAGALCGRE